MFAAVFAVLGLWPGLSGLAPRWWSLAVAAACAGLALLRPAALAPFNRLWFRFGLALHRVTTPAILAVLFFAVFTPAGMVLRLLGKDPLRLRRGGDSYWLPRAAPPQDMRNQF